MGSVSIEGNELVIGVLLIDNMNSLIEVGATKICIRYKVRQVLSKLRVVWHFEIFCRDSTLFSMGKFSSRAKCDTNHVYVDKTIAISGQGIAPKSYQIQMPPPL